MDGGYVLPGPARQGGALESGVTQAVHQTVKHGQALHSLTRSLKARRLLLFSVRVFGAYVKARM